jgi:hypothetical protein
MAETTKKIMTEIVIDDGSVKVPIRNHHGDEIGMFYFRPTDVGIIDRYNQVVGDFDKITEPLQHVSIKADGTAADDATDDESAALKEATDRLYRACDYLFGGNMSEAFFGQMNPFSPVDGHFFCENAIDAVGKFISAQFDTEQAKVQRQVAKYTHGYAARTGKHKDGKK